jgi:hypothetical protein
VAPLPTPLVQLPDGSVLQPYVVQEAVEGLGHRDLVGGGVESALVVLAEPVDALVHACLHPLQAGQLALDGAVAPEAELQLLHPGRHHVGTL